MTLARRVIACLDVDRGRVVKGVRFGDLRDVGDPGSLAVRYETEGADEIVFLDISATTEERETVFALVERTARRLFVPLTLGGGIRSLPDVERALRAGADKVSLNTAALERPALLTAAAARFGTQCVVASIDVARAGDHWRVWTHGGRTSTPRGPVGWARECVARGAGEILLTSIDRDGTRTGYDRELTAAIADAVSVPVIASGGAGSASDVADILASGTADAALVAGILHEGLTTIGEIKELVRQRGIPIRPMAPC
ncbi:MAG TPA: imidazole glycerol phosphate synthase subunit HisF [Gemmatimonadaceae bacterium]|nr:imidazole glycerol phosphate synthase subunit HisF [Gemmatimonadaceae bacterium]